MACVNAHHEPERAGGVYRALSLTKTKREPRPNTSPNLEPMSRTLSAWKPFGPALSRAVVSAARYDNGGTMLSWIRPAAATML